MEPLRFPPMTNDFGGGTHTNLFKYLSVQYLKKLMLNSISIFCIKCKSFGAA